MRSSAGDVAEINIKPLGWWRLRLRGRRRRRRRRAYISQEKCDRLVDSDDDL